MDTIDTIVYCVQSSDGILSFHLFCRDLSLEPTHG